MYVNELSVALKTPQHHTV